MCQLSEWEWPSLIGPAHWNSVVCPVLYRLYTHSHLTHPIMATSSLKAEGLCVGLLNLYFLSIFCWLIFKKYFNEVWKRVYIFFFKFSSCRLSSSVYHFYVRNAITIIFVVSIFSIPIIDNNLIFLIVLQQRVKAGFVKQIHRNCNASSTN